MNTCQYMGCCLHPRSTTKEENYQLFDSEYLRAPSPTYFFVNPRGIHFENDKYRDKVWNQETNLIGSGGSMCRGNQFEVHKIQVESPQIFMGKLKFVKGNCNTVFENDTSSQSFFILEKPVFLDELENYYLEFQCLESRKDKVKITLVGTLTSVIYSK